MFRQDAAISCRLTRTRGITAIRRDVDLNGWLWDLAAEVMGPDRVGRGSMGEGVALAPSPFFLVCLAKTKKSGEWSVTAKRVCEVSVSFCEKAG